MATKEDVRKLAALSRVRLSDAELDALTKEFDAILAYVGQLDALSIDTGGTGAPRLRNVMREDGDPHAPGAHTGKIAAQFPARDGDYLEVKQIISYD
jgi:aspartyl/glutamyl-tRNA(Asn/Gln) amidotransferase C subunit